MVSNKIYKMKSGVFIDYSNLFWAENDHYNWTIDYLKLKEYLKKRYSPVFHNFYCAKDTNPTTPEFKRKAQGSESFYAKLVGYGYNVIAEPLKYIKDEGKEPFTKGDRDADIITAIGASLKYIDAVILFSGDGDFLKTIKYCSDNGKYVRVYAYDKSFAHGVRTFLFNQPKCNFKLLDEIKESIRFDKKTKVNGKFSCGA